MSEQKGFSQNIGLIVVGVLVIASVVWGVVRNNSQQDSFREGENMTEDGTMMNDEAVAKDDAMMKDDSMMKDDKMMGDDAAMMSKEGIYADYSAQRVEDEQKAGRKVILYFHAKWCPECRAAEADFKANPEKIPEGVAVLKLDYDTETMLKQKYGVTYQHTFVQIDGNENLVTKWISGDTDLLAKNVK